MDDFQNSNSNYLASSKLVHRDNRNRKNNSAFDIDRISYPKLWFITVVFMVIVFIIAVDLWLYKDYYDKQQLIISRTTDSVAEEINFNLLRMENKILEFSKDVNTEDISKKSDEEIIDSLELDFHHRYYISKVEILNNKDFQIQPDSESKNNINNSIVNIQDRLFNSNYDDKPFNNFGKNKPYKKSITKMAIVNSNLNLIFETQILHNHINKSDKQTKNEQSQDKISKIDNSIKILRVYIDIHKIINLYLKHQYSGMKLGFKFRVQNNDELVDYIIRTNKQIIKHVNFKPDNVSGNSELLDTDALEDSLKVIHSVNLLHNNNWQIKGYLEVSEVQEFVIWLIKVSLFIIFVTLLTANFIYRRFYYLERQRLKIIKEKNRFQQRAEITLATVQEGVIITNSTAQIVYVNHIIEDYLSAKLIHLYFKTFDDLIPELSVIKNTQQEQIKLGDTEISLNNKKYIFDIQATKLFDENRDYLGTAIFLHDITQKKLAQQRVNYLAYHDDSTGLANRVSLLDYYSKLISEESLFHSEHCKLFSVVMSIANLKNLNDTIGYEKTDKAILNLISLIKSFLSERGFKDSLYRAAGDVFVITLIYDSKEHGKSSMLYITNFMNNLIVELNKPLIINEQTIYLQFYFGISIYPDNFSKIISNEDSKVNPQAVLRFAEIAMSAARKKGLNKYTFYSEDINISIQELFVLENELRTAIRENKLELLYHPQIQLSTNKLRGFEILVRWQRDDGTTVMPGTFIPLLEKSGLIVTVGDWILREACTQGVRLLENKVVFETLAVNISGLQLQSENFLQRLKKILDETKFPKDKLELEITETTLFENTETVIRILNEIRAEGIGIALDDFGTGFSSLSYLKDLPLDYLKIDRAFVREINVGDTRLLEAILAIGKSMNLLTIAEGVETEKQVSFLREHFCDIIQGYYISKPVDLDSVIPNFKSV